jgi:hypothetical protein
MDLKHISLLGLFKSEKISKKISRGMFFVLIFGLFILEAFVVKDSVLKVLNWEEQIPAVSPAKGVRINFADYDKVVNRIQSASEFKPSGGTGRSLFNPKSSNPELSPATTTPVNITTSTPANISTSTKSN